VLMNAIDNIRAVVSYLW